MNNKFTPKRMVFTACTVAISLAAQAQDTPYIPPIPASEIPSGWYYYDGDEFNAPEINKEYWGIYGDTGVGNSRYGQPQGMLQTYRKKQVSIVTQGDATFARIHATRDDNPPRPTDSSTRTRPGWWSGALSSRDTKGYGYEGKLYPLFSRIEIRAKIPYRYGVWMALWLRHYLGASVAELDIEEFFVKYYNRSNRSYTVNQTVHMHNDVTNRQDVNVNKMDRYVKLPDNPEENFHVYGVQIDPDESDPNNHAVIKFLLDGQVTNTWKTIDFGDTYNTFITRALDESKEMKTWDVAITGQIGGKDSSVGFPEDADPMLKNLDMDIDWFRVFTRKDYHNTSGIKTLDNTSRGMELSLDGRKLTIGANAYTGKVSVYNCTGTLVQEVSMAHNTTTIALPAAGIYLVKAGNNTYKALVK